MLHNFHISVIYLRRQPIIHSGFSRVWVRTHLSLSTSILPDPSLSSAMPMSIFDVMFSYPTVFPRHHNATNHWIICHPVTFLHIYDLKHGLTHRNWDWMKQESCRQRTTLCLQGHQHVVLSVFHHFVALPMFLSHLQGMQISLRLTLVQGIKRIHLCC